MEELTLLTPEDRAVSDYFERFSVLRIRGIIILMAYSAAHEALFWVCFYFTAGLEGRDRCQLAKRLAKRLETKIKLPTASGFSSQAAIMSRSDRGSPVLPPSAYRSSYTGVKLPGNFSSSSADINSTWSFTSMTIKRIDGVMLGTEANSLLSVIK